MYVDLTLYFAENFAKQKSCRFYIRILSFYTLHVRSLIFVARVHAKCIVRNLQNTPSDVSIMILWLRPAVHRVAADPLLIVTEN